MVEKLRSVQDLNSAGENLLGIFAKEPVAGKVKTRLIPPLTAEQAADLYAASLAETVARMRRGSWRTILFYTGRRAFFTETFPDLELQPQGGGDLGRRMAHALLFLLAHGRRAVLVGSDSPDLPLRHLRQAFVALRRHDLVLAPAADGGYVLIGAQRHHPGLFRAIPWSTADVLSSTRRRAAELAISCAEVESWEDIDDLPSLRRLLLRSPQSATAHRAADLLARLQFPAAGTANGLMQATRAAREG